MGQFTCEFCGLLREHNGCKSATPRFCSAKCRYHAQAAVGIRPVHSKPHTDEAKAKIREARKKQTPWNKGKKGGVPWNKGLSKDNNVILAAFAESVKGKARAKRSKPYTPEERQNRSAAKRGDKNPAKRPEVREKIRQSMLRVYRDRPEILENRKPAGINQFSDGFTSIEKPVADELDRLGIHFLHNQKVGRYFVDFLVQGRVVIECDGEYWHRDGQKERRRDSALHAKGLFVFHLSGKEILRDAVACVRRVLRLYGPFVDAAV